MTGFSEEPQLPFAAPMDKASFLHWVQEQTHRYEFVGGQAVMHPGGTLRHGKIIGRFVTGLNNGLDPDRWIASPTDIAIEVGDDIRYPDVAVFANAIDDTKLSTDAPALLVEVLPPSSKDTDFRVKRLQYTSLPSLLAYVVASQDEAKAWLWLRDPETGAFPPEPQVLSGVGATLAVPALNIAIPVDEIYRGLLG